MDLEEYLLEEETPMLGIKHITDIADEHIRENYYTFGHGKELLGFMDKILALINSIQCINSCMLSARNDAKRYIFGNADSGDENIKIG